TPPLIQGRSKPSSTSSAEDQPLHSFESGTDCRPGRTRDSRRRRTRDNSAISAASGGCFGTIPLEVPTQQQGIRVASIQNTNAHQGNGILLFPPTHIGC